MRIHVGLVLWLAAAAMGTLASLPLKAGQRPGPAAPAMLRLDVVVVDERGDPVATIKASEFEVWISGYRVPVAHVYAITPESHPRTVVIVLDNWAIGHTLVPRVREAARHFVGLMGPRDQLAIVPLQGGRLERTPDRARLSQAIDQFSIRGFPFRPEDASEHLFAFLQSLSRQLAEVSDDRKAIVGIGAGWVFDAPLPPPGVRDLRPQWTAAMRALSGVHASLYAIDPVGVSAARGVYGGSSGFARETGGHAFLNTNDLRGAAARIWAESGTYYMLAMQDPPVQRTADLREVEVKVNRKGVTVRARKGITGRP